MNKNDPKNAEVLIAGAGPVGLMVACRLLHFNVPFRIIDKKKSSSSQSGAMILHSRTLEYFQQMGLVPDILKQGTILSGLTVTFGPEKSIRLSLEDKVLKQSEHPYIVMLEQSKTERLLIDYLEQKGHRIEWETELVSVVQSDEDVEAGLLRGDGTPDVMTVKYLIGADGSKSKVRELLKIPFMGKTHKSALTVMECEADIVVPAGEALFSFSGQATTGFFPLPGARWRVDAAFRNVGRRLQPLTFEKVQAIFNRKSGLNANIRNASWFSVFHSHGRYALHFMNDRCLLAGDAAHLFTPVGGQGMNTGLQDACNLAWKLAMVVNKRMSPGVLSTYEAERKPVAVNTCRWSDYFFKVAAPGNRFTTLLYAKLLPPVLRLLFKMMKNRKVADLVFKKVSGTGISYGYNQINVDPSDNFISSAPEPGDRVPHIIYKDNGKEVNLYEKLRIDRFVLLVFGDRKNVEAVTKAGKAYRDVVTTEVIPFNRETSVLYLHFGIRSQGWYLIRPDMHIACRSSEAGNTDLKAYLQMVFAGNG